MNLEEFAKRKFLSVIFYVLKQAKESFLEKSHKVISIYKPLNLQLTAQELKGSTLKAL